MEKIEHGTTHETSRRQISYHNVEKEYAKQVHTELIYNKTKQDSNMCCGNVPSFDEVDV